ncbi:hypothetical protein BH11PLA1_BH11PLA1_22470 [soil metagenome]
MTSILTIIFATLVGGFGAFVFWWALLADRFAGGKRRRRCPKCWYDLAGMPGVLTCPECGKVQRSEGRMHRARVRRGWAAAGLLVIAAAFGALGWSVLRDGQWRAVLPGAWVSYVDSMGDVEPEEWVGDPTALEEYGWAERWAVRATVRRMLDKREEWAAAPIPPSVPPSTAAVLAGRSAQVQRRLLMQLQSPNGSEDSSSWESAAIMALARAQRSASTTYPEWSRLFECPNGGIRITACETLGAYAMSRVGEGVRVSPAVAEVVARRASAGEKDWQEFFVLANRLNLPEESYRSEEHINKLLHGAIRELPPELSTNSIVVRLMTEQMDDAGISDAERDARVRKFATAMANPSVTGRNRMMSAAPLDREREDLTRLRVRLVEGLTAQYDRRPEKKSDVRGLLLRLDAWGDFVAPRIAAALQDGGLVRLSETMEEAKDAWDDRADGAIAAAAAGALAHPLNGDLACTILLSTRARPQSVIDHLRGENASARARALKIVHERRFFLTSETFPLAERALARVLCDSNVPIREKAQAAEVILRFTDGSDHEARSPPAP